jgi:hypothetical protein
MNLFLNNFRFLGFIFLFSAKQIDLSNLSKPIHQWRDSMSNDFRQLRAIYPIYPLSVVGEQIYPIYPFA